MAQKRSGSSEEAAMAEKGAVFSSGVPLLERVVVCCCDLLGGRSNLALGPVGSTLPLRGLEMIRLEGKGAATWAAIWGLRGL